MASMTWNGIVGRAKRPLPKKMLTTSTVSKIWGRATATSSLPEGVTMPSSVPRKAAMRRMVVKI